MTDTSETSAPPTVSITVDGRTIEAAKGELVIAAAERNGIYIPRFCYHSRMKPVGMCRMCIVEIDTGRGPALQPSCMIECADGMTVATDSPVTTKAQEGVLEFLLVNHPLDCPVCDKGGECPLQDQTMSYGPGESRFVEEKRHFEKPIPISDLVLLDRERCILCDRCTRFAKEVAGDPLIHFMDRGNETQVNTFPDHPFASYFSGNTVQICPVGALTAVPYRFKARPWDLDEVESTCTSCSVGCRIVVQSSRNQVLRYVGVDSDAVNWGWMCDKGRFDFEAVNSDDRLREPLVRDQGLTLKPAAWNDALRRAAAAIRDGLERTGPAGFAVVGGARLTNEDQYAWSKLTKGLIGSDNIDAQVGDGLPAEAVLGLPRATIDDACRPGGAVLVIGPDVKEELPVLFLRLRHAVLDDGVKLVELASTRTSLTGELAAVSLRYRPGHALAVVRALLAGKVPDDDVGGVSPEAIRAAAEVLGDGPLTVIVGRANLAESGRSIAAAAAAVHHTRADVRFLSALRRANVHGALELGMAPGLLPGRVTLDGGRDWFAERWPTLPGGKGLDTSGILRAAADGKIDTLVLLGADPLADFPDRDLAERGMAGARTVIALDQFLTESVKQADVVLPVAGFAEVDGTTTNIEGRVSVLGRKVTAPGTAQSDWTVAAELADRLDLDLGLESTRQIAAEIEQVAPAFAGLSLEVLTGPAGRDGVVVTLPTRRTADGDRNGDGAGREARAVDQAAATGEAAVAAESSEGASPELTPTKLLSPTTGVPLPVWTIIEPPSPDAYSLRLVVTRKLYDRGTLVRSSPSLADLAETAILRLHPHDFDRLGVAPGDDVRITSSRGSITVPTVPDDGVPRGTAHVYANKAGGRANMLIDGNAPITDVRVERP
ncbi:MAG TPA: NADH-quinone oxidoreductase subunit NuoG [Acidimicrobiales bacterium]|nr:NADH-quinone oxidoreductase subunit NuoG [Acidimicrobiales bacterium]HEU0171485.1 NADH-quinone oxidoreductase subunit NuoG [Acidimicrobiales bacterium]